MSFWTRIERRLEDLAGDLLPDENRIALERATEALQSGQLELAKERVDALILERPEHHGSLLLAGLIRIQLGDFEAAKQYLEQAKTLGHESSELSLALGQVDAAQGRHGPALLHFQDALRRAGGRGTLLSEIYRGRGLSHRALGDWEKAIRELRKAVVEAPHAPEGIAALGDTLVSFEAGSNDEARRFLERITHKGSCPPTAWIGLAKLALIDDDPRGALEHLEAAEEGANAALKLEIATTKAQAYLGAEMLEEARLQSELALELHPASGEAMYLLARACHLKAPSAASRLLHRAFNTNELTKYAELGLEIALRETHFAEANTWADRLLQRDPNDHRAIYGKALVLISEDKVEGAIATLQLIAKAGQSPYAHLRLAELALAGMQIELAKEHALSALRINPRDEEAKALVNRCGAAGLGITLSDKSSYYDLGTATRLLCQRHPALASLQVQANRILAEFDLPLLVAVMGEFSAGKSSFVNAFIGQDLAPTGITPTTATINILKYGRSPSARIVYRDKDGRDIDEEALRESLAALDDSEVRRIEHVEIMVPIEILKRVHIVDTPGLNSIAAEHEAVARSFLARADAVVWLFTANQAGKSSERKALNSIAEQGVRILGVLNKSDQLTEAQIAEIQAHVSAELGGLVDHCIPVSTRNALANQEDPAWQELLATLESKYFSHAREIKAEVLSRRIRTLWDLAEELASSNEGSADEVGSQLYAIAEALTPLAIRFIEKQVEEERRSILLQEGTLFREGAIELLELIRPRNLPFGSHKASPADRDYLLTFLEQGYTEAFAASYERSASSLRSEVESLLAALSDSVRKAQLMELVETRLRLWRAEVFSQPLHFIRGHLRGGSLDKFFYSDLPKVDLQEDSLYRSLFACAPQWDAEFSLPFARAVRDLASDLQESLEQSASLAEFQGFEADAGLRSGLATLRAHLETLQGETR